MTLALRRKLIREWPLVLPCIVVAVWIFPIYRDIYLALLQSMPGWTTGFPSVGISVGILINLLIFIAGISPGGALSVHLEDSKRVPMDSRVQQVSMRVFTAVGGGVAINALIWAVLTMLVGMSID